MAQPMDNSSEGKELICAGCHQPISGQYYQVGPQFCCTGCAAGIHHYVQSMGFAWEPGLRGAALGLAAALAGAVAWALAAKGTNGEWGVLAIGIGILVSLAVVRGAGGRRGPQMQAIAMGLSLLSIVLGKALLVGWVSAGSLPSAVPLLLRQAGSVFVILIELFHPMDLLWYGIAAYEGFRIARSPRLAIQGPFRAPAPVLPSAPLNFDTVRPIQRDDGGAV